MTVMIIDVDDTRVYILFSKVFRHGDKVPHREFQNYPNDPHREHSYYPMGNGDLTNVSTQITANK